MDITTETITVGELIVDRARQAQCTDVFGIPGDYSMNLIDALSVNGEKSKLLTWRGFCNELEAGYAAAGYARVKPMSILCITSSVGSFSALNAVAGAYAERSPVLVVCGLPKTSLSKGKVRMHHIIDDDHTAELDVFKAVTAYATIVNDSSEAVEKIDRAFGRLFLTCRPVFLGIPQDVVDQTVDQAPRSLVLSPPPSPRTKARMDGQMDILVKDATKAVQDAKDGSIALLFGIETRMFRVQHLLEELLKKLKRPFYTSVAAKGIVSEAHVNFHGVYWGVLLQGAEKTLEAADCILCIGFSGSDIETGIFSARLQESKTVFINHDSVPGYTLDEILTQIVAAMPQLEPQPTSPFKVDVEPACESEAWESKNILSKIVTSVRDNSIQSATQRTGRSKWSIVVDAGESFFTIIRMNTGALPVHMQSHYLSIGWSVPAAIGVAIADPSSRVLCLVGDGAFQMTSSAVSTAGRFGVNVSYVLLNNDGYTTERLIRQGDFNDIQKWNYTQLISAYNIRNSVSLQCCNMDELSNTIRVMLGHKGVSLLEMVTTREDISEALLSLSRKVSEASISAEELVSKAKATDVVGMAVPDEVIPNEVAQKTVSAM